MKDDWTKAASSPNPAAQTYPWEDYKGAQPTPKKQDAQQQNPFADLIPKKASAPLPNDWVTPPPSPPKADDFEAALKKMHPKVAAWAREHKDDVLRPEKKKLALAADAMAIAKGFKPGSDEYLNFLDEQMGYFPKCSELKNPDTKPCRYPDGTTFVPGAAHSDDYFKSTQ